MKEELDVITDEGKVIVYIKKEEAVERLNTAILAKNTAEANETTAQKDSRQAYGRIKTVRIVIERILDEISPSDDGWILPVSNSDLMELRGMLDLKENVT